jgi:ABC-type nitrate/sulfonate/bicarbonate transport system permease component
MTTTQRVRPGRAAAAIAPVWTLRIAIIGTLMLAWEALARSGLLFQDVVPSLIKIAAALGALLASPDFYSNLGVTAM